MQTPHKVYEITKKDRKQTYFQVNYKDPISNKWKTKTAPVNLTSIEQVEYWFTYTYNPIATVQAKSQPKKSIATLYPQWLKIDRVKNDPNLSNMKGHLNNHILTNKIAHIDLEKELEPKVCIDFIASIQRAPNTQRNIIQTLREFIDDCRKDQLIDYKTLNLFRDKIVADEINGGKPIEKIAGSENIIAFDEDQVMTLLASPFLPLDRRARYYIAISAGLRDSELAGLKWKDIKDNTITVDRQLVRHKTPIEFKEPKKKSYRTIPLHPQASAILASWKEQGWMIHVGQTPNEEDPVFPNMLGHHYHPRSAALLRADLKKVGLSECYNGLGGRTFPFEFQAARRTFASRLELVAGVERARISALMGHRAGGVTAKHYITRNLDSCRDAIAKVPLPAILC